MGDMNRCGRRQRVYEWWLRHRVGGSSSVEEGGRDMGIAYRGVQYI